MDESEVRTLLQRVGSEPMPPARFDLRQVRDRGRRRLRWRRLYLPAAVAAAATVAAVIAMGVPLGLNSGHRSPQAAGMAGRVVAPRRFDPLVPYALFGWLPAGYSAERTGLAEDVQESSGETLIAEPPHGAGILLMVYATGTCHITRPRHTEPGPQNPGFAQDASSLDCSGFDGQLNSRAPSVNGGSAYWSTCRPEEFCPPRSSPAARLGRALVWQYGNNAWAVLGPRGSISSHRNVPDLLRVARNIRYGNTVHEAFGFRLRDVPAQWRVSGLPDAGPAFRIANGIPANTFVIVGPLTIFAQPAGWPRSGCADRTDPVTIDGARGYFVTENGRQGLCFNDLHGMYLNLRLNVGVRGNRSGGYDSVQTAFRHLRLLGPDPKRWITNPFD